MRQEQEAVTGEPKTLTLTLEEAAEHISHNVESEYGTELSLARTREGWVILYWLGNGTAAYALSAPPRAHWDDAVRDAGVPVVARDEAAELRAANHAFVAFMEGHHRVLAALLPSNVLGPLAHLWNQATALHDDNRRRLAGGESER